MSGPPIYIIAIVVLVVMAVLAAIHTFYPRLELMSGRRQHSDGSVDAGRRIGGGGT